MRRAVPSGSAHAAVSRRGRSVERLDGAGERLIQDEDCVERGYLLVPIAAQQVHDGQAQAGRATAGQAVAIGEQFGDADLTATARHLQGHALIQQGNVAAGLRRLDDTMLAVVASESRPS